MEGLVRFFGGVKNIDKGKFDLSHPILTRGLMLPEPRELLQ